MNGKRLLVFTEVEKGPATARDVADATGLGTTYASAVLGQLATVGILARTKLDAKASGRAEYLYRVAA